jgi:hypothetical protein
MKRNICETLRMLVLAAGLGWAAGTGVALAAGEQQRQFDTPEAAVAALAAAAQANDEEALVQIFGEKHRDLLGIAGNGHEWENRERFARAAGEYRLLRPEADGRLTLVVGAQAWPFPVPLVRAGSAWRFDTDAGRGEILSRRIGANELAVIDTLHAYVGAQRQYAAAPRDGSRVRAFAQKVRSAPGKRDGLYWEADAAKGEEASPIGPLIPDARQRRPGEPFNGYHFKILTRQGAAAPAGAYSYVINGHMVAGFAMLAYPAEYGRTGVKSFVVNHYGEVYEKDLGPETAKLGPAMAEYNPDASWALAAD